MATKREISLEVVILTKQSVADARTKLISVQLGPSLNANCLASFFYFASAVSDFWDRSLPKSGYVAVYQ